MHMAGRVSHSVYCYDLSISGPWLHTEGNPINYCTQQEEMTQGSDNKWFSLVLEMVSAPLSMLHRHNQQWHSVPKLLQWLQHRLIHQSSQAYLHRKEKEYKIMEQSCKNWGCEIGQKACNWGYNSCTFYGLSKISPPEQPWLSESLFFSPSNKIALLTKKPPTGMTSIEREKIIRRVIGDSSMIPDSRPVCLFEWRSPEPASVYPESRDVH